jgi:hypothetical protein
VEIARELVRQGLLKIEVENPSYKGKDPFRAAAEHRVRRLEDRGEESMVKDLGLKPRVFRQRVPWVREPTGGRRPKKRR